jgi:hypothetical protein
MEPAGARKRAAGLNLNLNVDLDLDLKLDRNVNLQVSSQLLAQPSMTDFMLAFHKLDAIQLLALERSATYRVVMPMTSTSFVGRPSRSRATSPKAQDA